MEITKTSRILSVYHLFLNCQEVSFQELRQQFEVSEKTSQDRPLPEGAARRLGPDPAAGFPGAGKAGLQRLLQPRVAGRAGTMVL